MSNSIDLQNVSQLLLEYKGLKKRLEDTTFKLCQNQTNENGDTLLIQATRSGYFELVKHLIENNVNISEKNSHGETATSVAKNSNREIYEFLKNTGDNLNKMFKDKFFEAHRPDLKECYDIMKRGIDLEVLNSSMRYFLLAAIESRHNNFELTEEIVSYVIKNNGFDINDRKLSMTLLMHASSLGNVKIIDLLLKLGAEINLQDNWGDTALIFATTANKYSAVKYLVENGANVNIRGHNNCTPLIIAAYEGNLKIAKYLIDHGADVVDDRGHTALTVALEKGYDEIAEMLVDSGVHANLNNMFKKILENIICHDYMKTLKKLIDKGFDVDSQDYNGETALMYAARHGKEEAVKMLIKAGADLNIENNDGYSALFIAIANGYQRTRHEEIRKILIDAGASTINKKGKDIIEYAENISYFECCGKRLIV